MFSCFQVIHSTNRSHHGAVIKCEATNDIGTKMESLNLDVICKWNLINIFYLFDKHFVILVCRGVEGHKFNFNIFLADPPVFKQLPKSVEAEDEDEVELECEVDGNPLEIVWVHDPIDRVRII